MISTIKRAITTGIVLAGVVATFSIGTTAQAAALGDLQVIEYGWNAPGTDTSANRNAEFVRLKNMTGAPLEVEGWVLHDTYQTPGGDWGNRYTFRATDLPAGSPFNVGGKFTFPAGAEVYVYQGSGVDSTPTSSTASIFRNKNHIWNNAGDTIYVRTDKDAPSYVARVIYTGYRVKISQ